MLRSILRIRLKDKVKIQSIMEKYKAGSVGVTVKWLKVKYTEHICGEPEDKWNKILTFWAPHIGVRGRGRPLMRWADELVCHFGINCSTKARDRVNWKSLDFGRNLCSEMGDRRCT